MKHWPPVKAKKLRSPDRGSSLLEDAMSNDMAIHALIEFLYETEEPQISWPDDEFEEVSFSRWTAGELIHAIMDHPMVSAKDTIEEFALKMYVFSCMENGRKAGRIFSIASKFAYETLELFREEHTFYD